ncbi:COG4223 family protein [Devosia submarina]|uniref:COG4223 family protein n=1 Tax=Devosia submarina TaxID=1173082 RepID=UPI000D347BAF|nr:hypothetical protein [Devosia submarina]
MADNKGNDPKAGPDKPADGKSAAVKPPVLDLTARESSTATPSAEAPGKNDKPESKAGSKPPVTPPTQPDSKVKTKPSSTVPPTTKPADKTSGDGQSRSRFPIGATLAGGVLGLAAAYGIASAGLWPTPPAPQPAPDPRLAQFATAIPELETVTQTTQSELAALNQRIAALEDAEPVTAAAPPPAPAPAPAPAEPVDLSGIEESIAQLQSRVDALPAEPAAPQVDVESIRAEIAAIGSRVEELAGRLGTAETSLQALDTSVAQTTAALAEQPADIGAVLQLPLILSGLETAFATGRPFQTELDALRSAAPDTAPPSTVSNAAGTGLPRPDLVAQRFDAVLPAIIAAQPADPNAQWQQGAIDWFTSAIALRPTGELEGDTPQAITSRLESAVARRDFAAANELFAALPEPMRAAAGDVPALVAAQADAAQFLQAVRNQALASEAQP